MDKAVRNVRNKGAELALPIQGITYIPVPEDRMTPEQMRRAAKLVQEQHNIDFEEAGAKAPYDVVGYKGVRLESRWNVIDEFARMRRIVDGFSNEDGKKLSWIWCDSKAQACYSVGVRPGMFDDDLKWTIAAVFKSVGGGHNGISIEDGESAFVGKTLADLDPDWEWGDE